MEFFLHLSHWYLETCYRMGCLNFPRLPFFPRVSVLRLWGLHSCVPEQILKLVQEVLYDFLKTLGLARMAHPLHPSLTANYANICLWISQTLRLVWNKGGFSFHRKWFSMFSEWVSEPQNHRMVSVNSIWDTVVPQLSLRGWMALHNATFGKRNCLNVMVGLLTAFSCQPSVYNWDPEHNWCSPSCQHVSGSEWKPLCKSMAPMSSCLQEIGSLFAETRSPHCSTVM